MRTILRSIGTANPPRYASQHEVFRFLADHFPMAAEERDLYARLLLAGPIRGRHFGVDYDEQAARLSPDVLAERFADFGTRIGAEAARRALAEAHLAPEQIDALVVNTCTGYLCPGLSSYLAEALALRPDVRGLDLMGMGCGAALPNLQTSAALLAGGARRVLSVAVEICSATLFMGPEPELIVSNSIFGDGAAAAVLEAANGQPAGLAAVVDFESGLYPAHRELLRYRTQEGRLRNQLSRRVPVVAARAVEQVTGRLLARHGLEVADIDFWAVHPGGSAVLEQLGQRLGLDERALAFSLDVFRDCGNMSSPSVLFVLDRICRNARPRPGQLGVMLAFGAGFSAYAALLRFGP